VVRCPDCDTEIDLDEDEVEEGEILSCPECDVELEVTQVHPVHVIVLSEDEEEEEESEEDKEGDDEGNGDYGDAVEEDDAE
jgi:alpha-aminoadipate/glutamate carrier protein LysW